MLFKTLNFNQNRPIYRHANGVGLLLPEQMKEKTFYATGHTVNSILNAKFNVYFLDTNSAIQMTNEETVRICGFESTQDAIGRTIKEVFVKQSAEMILQNDLAVMQ